MGKRLKLGEMLVAKGLIDQAQLDSALAEQRRWGKRLGMTLVLMGVLEEETLIRTLAAQLKLPVARIRGKRVNAEVVELVPVELAEKHRCLPLFVKDQDGSRELFLAMEDPSDLDAQGELGFRIGFRIRPVLVAPTELEDALQRHYHWSSLMGQVSEAGEGFAPLGTPDRHAPDPPSEELPEPDDSLRMEPSLPPQEPVDLPAQADEPFEDTEPELHAAASAKRDAVAMIGKADPGASGRFDAAASSLAAELPGDTQPDPPDIDRAAAELGAFGESAPPRGGGTAQPRGTARAPAAERAPSPRPSAPRQPAAAMSADVILRALSQLLVEKGVLTRDELVERLRMLAARDAGDGTQS